MKRLHTFLGAILSIACVAPAWAGNGRILSWDDCVRETVQHNPALVSSAQRIQQSKAQKWVAASPALPQITTELTLNKSDSFSGRSGSDTNRYSVKGQQLIFDGFKTMSDVKAAEQNVLSSEYGYTANASDIRYNLRKAFVELLKAQTLVPIADGIIARRKQNLDMIRLRYESGREHHGSLLLAEADLAQAQFDLKKAQRDISVAQYALRKEMGWEHDTPLSVTGDFKIRAGSKQKPRLADIANSHPLVGKTEAERESAKHGVESAKGAFFPELKLNSEVGKVGSGGLASSENGWTVGLNMSLPVFDGGRRIASADNAVAKLMQTKADAKDRYNNVLSSLETAWQGLQDALDEREVQGKYLKAAEVRARISRAEYANGLLIFDNWIIIEDNYVRAQKTYVAAEAALLIAEAEWIRAQGGDLEYD